MGIAVDAAGRLYVANEGSNGNGASVTVFAPGVTGNATPTAIIAGTPRSGPFYPQGITVDARGTIYVTDAAYPTPAIRIYALDESGKFAPAAAIAGGNTRLADFVDGIAVDAAGQMYVASGRAIVIFAANATGNATPLATIGGLDSGLSGANYLAF
jgi:sugar lactone lactonase YvrE